MKKIKCLFAIFVLLFYMTACSGAADVTDQVANVVQAEDEHVLAVKNGTNSNYPEVTYGEAFEKYFGSPTWKYFKGSPNQEEESDGEAVDVVEFTGYCMYQDVEVKALIQFTLNDDDTFSATYLSFNDVPQGVLVLAAVIEDVFTTENDTASPETSTENVDKDPALENQDSSSEIDISDEPGTVDQEWYYTYTSFYSEQNEAFLDVIYYDDGSLDFAIDGVTVIHYSADGMYGDESIVSEGAIYYNCNAYDGTQIQYYPDTVPYIRIIGNDSYNGYYYAQ